THRRAAGQGLLGVAGESGDLRVVLPAGAPVDEADGLVDVGLGLVGIAARPLARRLGGGQDGCGAPESRHRALPSRTWVSTMHDEGGSVVVPTPLRPSCPVRRRRAWPPRPPPRRACG